MQVSKQLVQRCMQLWKGPRLLVGLRQCPPPQSEEEENTARWRQDPCICETIQQLYMPNYQHPGGAPPWNTNGNQATRGCEQQHNSAAPHSQLSSFSAFSCPSCGSTATN